MERMGFQAEAEMKERIRGAESMAGKIKVPVLKDDDFVRSPRLGWQSKKLR